MYGCRINSMVLEFAQNQVVTGTFDIRARQIAALSATSVFASNDPALDMASDPFTSPQVAIYEADYGEELGTALATAVQLTLRVERSAQGKWTLGSRYPRNRRRGTRMISFEGMFCFQNEELYNKAKAASYSVLRIKADDEAHYIQFDIPRFKWLPNQSTPKVNTDGPLDIRLSGEATLDADGEGTDIICTVYNDEENIDD
jgi:hypothetical protein